MRYKHVLPYAPIRTRLIWSSASALLRPRPSRPISLSARPLPAAILPAGPGNTPARSVYGRGEERHKDELEFAYSMAEGELVTIAHQDDMYHRDYSARLLAAHRRYPDMTVFTTDYVIVKQGTLITGDAMLWIKRILRTPLRFPQMNDRAWVKKLAFVLGNPICCPATTYHKAVLG